MKALDLTQQPPRSPKSRLGGFVIAARTTDKCRASLNGKLGDYHFDCPLDNVLFGFKGIKGDEFKAAIQSGKSDEEMGAWLQSTGVKKTPEEIKAWSDKAEKSSIYTDPEKREYFVTECKKLGLNPEKTTTFDWLEADDKAMSKGK